MGLGLLLRGFRAGGVAGNEAIQGRPLLRREIGGFAFLNAGTGAMDFLGCRGLRRGGGRRHNWRRTRGRDAVRGWHHRHWSRRDRSNDGAWGTLAQQGQLLLHDLQLLGHQGLDGI